MQAERDKKLENEATFRTWKEQKDEKLLEKLRSGKKKDKKEEDEIQKQQERKQDAAKVSGVH